MTQRKLLLSMKQTNVLICREQSYGCQGEDAGGVGIVIEFGMDMHTLLYLKWIANNDLLYST